MFTLISVMCLLVTMIITILLRKQKKKIHPAYLATRTQALNNVTDTQGFPKDKVLGVVIEEDHLGGRITVVVSLDGRVEYYSSSQAPDQDMLDAPDYVKTAARELVELAQTYYDKSIKTDEIDFPEKDHIKIFLLTPQGRGVLKTLLWRAAEKGHVLYPLHTAFNHLSKEIGHARESRKYASGSMYVVEEE